jgi:hypothetical protein
VTLTTLGTDDFFAGFTRTAWRLEAQPAYGTPTSDPSFGAFLANGMQLPPLDERPAKQQWMAAVRHATQVEGKQLARVHVLSQPLTPYRVYELATYPENIAAGEDVRIASVDDHPELGHLDTDFWLLDDTVALVMDYDDHGRFVAATRTDDPGVLEVCHDFRALAIACSVPLQEFLQPA